MLQQRPRIGLVPDVDLTRNRGVDYRRHLIYAELCDRLHEAGALPLVLPYPPDDEVLEAQLGELDGVLLPGGDFDVDPRRYGQAPHPRLGTIKPDRTDFEIKLCQHAHSDGIPLLGICAGMQVLNVARGGSLWQHLPEQRPSALTHVQPHNRKLPSHTVELVTGTRLAAVCGAGPLEVNSTHHQGIQELGRDLVAVAVATDGLIEAIEDPVHPFCVGVQWHPETLEQVTEAHRHRAVFVALVGAARRRRAERQGAVAVDRC